MCRCRAGLALGGVALGANTGLDSPAALAGFLVALLLSLSVHESAHAWTAWRLGDDTGKVLGRITLNPIPHIDPIGTIALPILMHVTNSNLLFGWAKPTPFNPLRFRRPFLGIALTAGAGPVSNVLLAFLFAVFVGLALRFAPGMTEDNAGLQMLVTFVQLNVGLAVFNLLPVPPLDGSKVVAGLLPRGTREAYLSIDAAGFVIILVLSGTGLLDRILAPPVGAMYDAVFRVVEVARG